MVLKSIKRCKRLASFMIICAISSLSLATDLSKVDHQAVTIWSQGTRLAADIYKPKSLTDSAKLPGILLIPGWGGSKNNVGKNYAPYFAEQGFIVLSFDFRSWGESDGFLVASERLAKTDEASRAELSVSHIRKIINPFAMSDDVRAALYYLGSEPQVQENNLGVWGTSMGGGLALIAAATDDRVKALSLQMSPVNYPYNLRAIPDKNLRQAEAMVTRGHLPPFPDHRAKLNPELNGYPDWAAMKRFNPIVYADQLTAPTLIIDAAQESLFDTKMNGQMLHDSIKEQTESRYLVLPGGHYDLYKGDSLKTARETALQWFIKHLTIN